MNKEEIEQVEKIKKMLNFMTEGTSLRINNEVSKLLLKYIQQLELNVEALKMEHKHDIAMIDEVKGNAVKWSKEKDNLKVILDKVTDLLTRIATENAKKYNSENQKEVDFSEWNLALEILNIIEGEKK